jgi:hypothetical protein
MKAGLSALRTIPWGAAPTAHSTAFRSDYSNTSAWRFARALWLSVEPPGGAIFFTPAGKSFVLEIADPRLFYFQNVHNLLPNGRETETR